MQLSDPSPDRRRFIRLALGLSTGVLLAGCGGGDPESGAITVVPAAAANPVATTQTTLGSHPLNLALNLAYLGAQYHGFAARGVGLADTLTRGIGQAGAASGARQATFTDPLIAGYAAELADDKLAHVVALRSQIGALAAAQPRLDLSTDATGAFALAAQKAGITATGNSFDPYASDTGFLIGAFMVENAAAATYRTLLAQTGDATAATVLERTLADAIYHGGLIRALLDDKAATDATVDQAIDGTGTMLAAIDGTDVGDQTLANATGASSNILDAASRPIPFTRAGTQVLKALYLSGSGLGGFLPAGANGVAV